MSIRRLPYSLYWRSSLALFAGFSRPRCCCGIVFRLINLVRWCASRRRCPCDGHRPFQCSHAVFWLIGSPDPGAALPLVG